MTGRRNVLRMLGSVGGLGSLGLAPWLASAATQGAVSPPSARLVAAWEGTDGFRVGLLAAQTQGVLHVAQSIDVPTRAHGVLALADDSVLAVARRPGDWLLRWWPGSSKPVQWQWIEPSRAFSGHVIASPDGKRLFTTETNLETGAGLVGVRDARSLQKLDEWPTFGIDAHELLWDTSEPDRATLMVANGGIPTQPETGRAKLDLDQMDSSLVRLNASGGTLLGQWRLGDPRLSLRHLAWHNTAAGKNPMLGIALQAEHDHAAQKNRAPVIALFDGSMLKPVEIATPLAGYGGAICALPDGWAVGCPRANGVALFGTDGSWRELIALPHACAVAMAENGCWAGGQDEALWTKGKATAMHRLSPDTVRLDNHWALMPKSSRKA